MDSTESLNILLLEDDLAYAQALALSFARKKHQLVHCETGQELQTKLNAGGSYDLVLLDLKLEQETSLPFIQGIREAMPSAQIFMITGFASIATTVEAIKLGADDYLPKPVSANDILKRFFGEDIAETDEEEAMSPKRLEWEYIQRVLAENDGNISRTAKQLNMHRRTLQRKLQKKPQG